MIFVWTKSGLTEKPSNLPSVNSRKVFRVRGQFVYNAFSRAIFPAAARATPAWRIPSSPTPSFDHFYVAHVYDTFTKLQQRANWAPNPLINKSSSNRSVVRSRCARSLPLRYILARQFSALQPKVYEITASARCDIGSTFAVNRFRFTGASAAVVISSGGKFFEIGVLSGVVLIAELNRTQHRAASRNRSCGACWPPACSPTLTVCHSRVD